VSQPFIQHVQELRRRLAWSALVLGAGAVLGYILRDPLLDWLQAPLHGNLYYTKITGAFDFLMLACLLVGLLCAIPVIVYNLISFVRPALPRPVSRRQIAALVTASSCLTIGGAAFAYYLSLPTVFHFLSTIDVSHLHPLIAADSYLTFVITYLAVFALIFQLPLILLFIDSVTPLPPARLRKWRKWVILGAFTAALVLPIAPDPVSQILLALPVVVLYEVSLWLVVLANLRRRRAPAPHPRPYTQAADQPAGRLPEPAPVEVPRHQPAMFRPALDPLHRPRVHAIDMRARQPR
jgi:sec-independent protein translocase protein TatC